MEDKIRIANWLLTRKCNLKCDYCAIVKNYANKAKEYPDMNHYLKNEMTTDYVLEGLRRFKAHNPDCFHIFYGGEPMLRKDLPEIINFCNRENIYYTIITNNTPQVQPMIKKLIEKTDYIQGITSSVDPVFNDWDTDASDRVRKSLEGFKRLVEYKAYINDVVAEITVMHSNLRYLYDLVKRLSGEGINSDITFIDIAKNSYYDFSNITDQSSLVYKDSHNLSIQLMDILADDSLDVHMKNFLIPKIWSILPSNMDCEIEKNLHNVSIDADGSVRLCLRIRGVYSPQSFVNDRLFAKGTNCKEISPFMKMSIANDKKRYCKLCNHTCLLMSKYGDRVDDLVHLDRREVTNGG